MVDPIDADAPARTIDAERLNELHANMEFESCKLKRRADGTFKKNRDEAIRIVLFFYGYKNNESNETKAEMKTLINPILLTRMDDSFNSIAGNVTPFKIGQAARKVARAWWDGESRCPLDLEAMAAKQYCMYLKTQLKKDGIPLEPKCYQNKMSNLNNFFKNYRLEQNEVFRLEVKQYMDGLVRLVAKAKQNGIGKIETGKRHISFELYCKLCQWFCEDGTHKSIFARAFLVLTWNLMCRGASTDGICLKHLQWTEDSFGISFSHVKNDQTGSRNFHPRHIYANPDNYFICPVTSMMEYFLTFPDIFHDENGHIFVGPEQEERFSEALEKLISKPEYKSQIADMGYNIDDIGVHSIRKGAGTYASSGTTAGPNSVSINNRGGWTLGGVRDVYLLYERAGDQYVGRVLSGLDVMSPNFECSSPEFVSTVQDVSVEEQETQQAELMGKVNTGLISCFGELNGSLKSIRKFLRRGLACVYHFYDKVSGLHPATSPLFMSPAFRDDTMLALKDKVKVTYPWKDDSKIVKLTGIPPHVKQLAMMAELKRMVGGMRDEILGGVERLMDDRTMNGTLSEARMGRLLDERQQPLVDELRELRQQLGAASNRGIPAVSRFPGGVDGPNNSKMWFNRGVFRRVPPTWVFPTTASLQVVYVLWHTRDSVSGVCALKELTNLDVNWLKTGCRRLEELRFLMMKLDREAERQGILPNGGDLTAADCAHILPLVQGALRVPLRTPKGRKRFLSRLKWPTLIPLMPAQNRKRSRVDAPVIIRGIAV